MSEAHVYAEVYKAVYAAHSGKFDCDRKREAEIAARDAVWTFQKTQPRNHGVST